MADYSGMSKDQLRELCLNRSLPVSGTIPELIARLQGADAAAEPDGEEALLAAAGITAPPVDQSPPPVPTQTPRAPVQPRQEPAPDPSESRASHTVHRMQFECPGELATEDHERWLRATENAAHGSGFNIRGGARRVSFMNEGGKRYAVYEVTLGRRDRQVG